MSTKNEELIKEAGSIPISWLREMVAGGFECEEELAVVERMRDALEAAETKLDAVSAAVNELDRARAHGEVYTYGQIQARLRDALNTPRQEGE